jgi:hypothetical protein
MMREETKQTEIWNNQNKRGKEMLMYKVFAYHAIFKKRVGMQSLGCTLRTCKGKVHKLEGSKIEEIDSHSYD